MNLILLDWTRMGKSFCLAGAVLEGGRVRVVRPLPVGDLSRAPVRNVGWPAARLAGHVRWEIFELIRPEPLPAEPPHLEDLGVRALRSLGVVAPNDLRIQVLQGTTPAAGKALFGAPLKSTRTTAFLTPGAGERSLATVVVPAARIRFGACWREGHQDPDVRVTLPVPGLGARIVPAVGPVLVVSLEAPTRLLRVEPGTAGEAAALFGDAAAAGLVCDAPHGGPGLTFDEVELGVDGAAGHLIRVEPVPLQLHLDGVALAGRAIAAMTEALRGLLQRHELRLTDLAAVVIHGGNGRLPALLARHLGLSPEQVLSSTPATGNLGSASLPAAWALATPKPRGPVAWVATGAGLTWGAALMHHRTA